MLRVTDMYRGKIIQWHFLPNFASMITFGWKTTQFAESGFKAKDFFCSYLLFNTGYGDHRFTWYIIFKF